MSLDRATALEQIRRNIESHRFHIYVVGGNGSDRRFVYTIGLRESLGAELDRAGRAARDDRRSEHGERMERRHRTPAPNGDDRRGS